MKFVYVQCIQIFGRLILASSTFQTSCSIPPKSTNLVLAADVRGTFDILWTSLFTLLTCCWTVQHLNVPRQIRKPGVNNTFGIIKRSLISIQPKLKWMLLTLFMPEFLVGKALQDRRLAKEFIAEVTKREIFPDGLSDGLRWAKEHWTLTHGFYAGMGGFAIKTKSPDDQVTQAPIFLDHRSLLYVCGVTRIVHEGISWGRETVNPSAIVREIPEITEEEIKDKSKSDFFIKVITIGQLIWFIIQVIARGIRGLAIPQLEIAVLAYAACTVITYYLCLSKPKDVQIPTFLYVKGSTEPQVLSTRDRDELARLHPVSWFKITLRSHRFFGVQRQPNRYKTILSPIPNDARYSHQLATRSFFPGHALLTHMDDGFILAGMVFGAIHCASWYSDFPTPIEQLLWQISSVSTATLLPVYYFFFLLDIHRGSQPIIRYTSPILEFLAVLGYILARLYLVVEIFRSLCFQPSSAFVSTWSSEIPHVV